MRNLYIHERNADEQLGPDLAETWRSLVQKERRVPIRYNTKEFLTDDVHSGASIRAYLKVDRDGDINGGVTITDCGNQIHLEVNMDTPEKANRTLGKYRALRDYIDEYVEALEDLMPYVEEMDMLEDEVESRK